MGYTVETYTVVNGSNMDGITYNEIPMEQIAEDMIRSYDSWDYAWVYDDRGRGICVITRTDGVDYDIRYEVSGVHQYVED